MEARIKAISYYLPEEVIDNRQLQDRFPEWNMEKIAEKTGILKRHIAQNNEYASDLAVAAAEKLFSDHQVLKSEIDYLLFCTQSPDYNLPTTACILQERLGLPTTAGALDFNLGCSGFVYGLSLAKGLIVGGMAQNILLITAETYSKYIHPGDKSNLTIFGDAAAATLISADQGFARIDEFIFGTDGSGAGNLIVKHGGARYPSDTLMNDHFDTFGNPGNARNLFMDGPEIFNFTLDRVPGLVAEILKKNKISHEDVTLYILHQANKHLLNHLKKKMKIPDDQFYINMESFGNTVSSTIPIALVEAQAAQLLIFPGKLLLAGFGVGYSWAGCILSL